VSARNQGLIFGLLSIAIDRIFERLFGVTGRLIKRGSTNEYMLIAYLPWEAAISGRHHDGFSIKKEVLKR